MPGWQRQKINRCIRLKNENHEKWLSSPTDAVFLCMVDNQQGGREPLQIAVLRALD